MNCPEYDVFAEYYDHVLPYQGRADVAFIVGLAREAGGPVLEMACGTGRVLIPCARAGVEMVGADASPSMLARCAANLQREPEHVRARVELHEADMRRFDLGRTFALVTLPFRGFQHLLTPEDQRAGLRALRDHLAPGGRLVLDFYNPSMPFLGDERWLAEPLVEPPFTMPDGRIVRRSYRIAGRDWFAQQQDVEMAYHVTWPDGRQEVQTERFLIRYTFRYEAEHLLAREGFALEAVYGDYAGTPYGKTAYPGDLVFIARLAS